MVRLSTTICAIYMVCSPLAYAAGQRAITVADTQPSPADLQQVAEKSCNQDLDRDHFDYTTMDECVSDKVAKMQRQGEKPILQSAVDSKSARPNRIIGD